MLQLLVKIWLKRLSTDSSWSSQLLFFWIKSDFCLGSSSSNMQPTNFQGTRWSPLISSMLSQQINSLLQHISSKFSRVNLYSNNRLRSLNTSCNPFRWHLTIQESCCVIFFELFDFRFYLKSFETLIEAQSSHLILILDEILQIILRLYRSS